MSTSLFRNLIFDLGGVLFRIDYDAPVRAFREMGCGDFDRLFSQAVQRPEFDLFETGRMSGDDFIAFLQEVSGVANSDRVVNAWNSILIGPWSDRIQHVAELRYSGYRTFLLSNTNSIHVGAFEAMMAGIPETSGFHGAFERVYYSNEIHMRKPDPEIFLYVCRENGLVPEETLFIDDSPQHIRGAQSIGLHAVLLEPGMELSELLERNGIVLK